MSSKKVKVIREKNSPRGLVPAAFSNVIDKPYNAFLDEVNPRANADAQFALAAASDARFRAFFDLMQKPSHRNWHLDKIAKICDISLPEWAEFWRKSQMQLALGKAANAIPVLTDNMISDAASKPVNCERCDGYGKVEGREEGSIRTCPACRGTGSISKIGDQHSRDKLLEMTGLTGKKSAAVVINQSFGGMGIDAATSRMSNITFDVHPDENSESESEPL